MNTWSINLRFSKGSLPRVWIIEETWLKWESLLSTNLAARHWTISTRILSIPHTTGKLQFGAYTSKISGVLDLRSTTRSVQEDQDLNLPSYKLYHNVHSRTNCQQWTNPRYVEEETLEITSPFKVELKSTGILLWVIPKWQHFAALMESCQVSLQKV